MLTCLCPIGSSVISKPQTPTTNKVCPLILVLIGGKAGFSPDDLFDELVPNIRADARAPNEIR